MEAKHTPGPWSWADVPGAGIQIRGPYKDSTRLLFSDIWRQFPEPKWDAEMLKNAQLATCAPELLKAVQEMVRTEMFLPVHPQRQAAYDAARAAINQATKQGE